jgi:SnoaL-like domain
MRTRILALLACAAIAGPAAALDVPPPGNTEWAKTPEPAAPSPFSPVVPKGHIEDYVQIVNLLNTYWIALDAGDIDTYAGLFTPDATIYWAGGIERGRDEIHRDMANFGSGAKKVAKDVTERGRLIHVMGSQRIDFTGPDTAHDVGMWMGFSNQTPDKSTQVAEFGHYEDRYVKVDGRWYFTERRIYNERISNKGLYYPELGEKDPRPK